MAGEVTNNFLAKLGSWEFVLACVAAGIAWGAMAQKVDVIEDKVVVHSANHYSEIKDIESEQKQMAKNHGELGGKVDVILVEQKHIKKDIEQVLELLKKEYPR